MSEMRWFWAMMVIARILEWGQKGQFPEAITMTALELKLWPAFSGVSCRNGGSGEGRVPG
jgi:hypothetical protein